MIVPLYNATTTTKPGIRSALADVAVTDVIAVDGSTDSGGDIAESIDDRRHTARCCPTASRRRRSRRR